MSETYDRNKLLSKTACSATLPLAGGSELRSGEGTTFSSREFNPTFQWVISRELHSLLAGDTLHGELMHVEQAPPLVVVSPPRPSPGRVKKSRFFTRGIPEQRHF